MANQGTIVRGVSPLAQSQSGLLAGALGAPGAALVAAGMMAAGAVGVLRGHRGLWTITRDDVLGNPGEPHSRV
jgi:hypothetical protein